MPLSDSNSSANIKRNMKIRTANGSSTEKSIREAECKNANGNTDDVQNGREDKNHAGQLCKRCGENVESISYGIEGNTRKED